MKHKKKLLAMLFLAAAASVSAFTFSACTDDNGNEGETPDIGITDPDTPLTPGACSHENVNHVAAESASCEEGGNKEYWFCDDCDKYFSDAELTVETTLAAVTLDELGHSYGELIPEVPAQTCVNGTKAHYHCDVCDTDFDKDKQEFLPPFGDITIYAQHDLTLVPAKEATCEEDGVFEAYRHCNACGYDFDEIALIEIEPMIEAALNHDYPADFTYDYAEKIYKKVCGHNEEHVITQAAGTEEYPHIISSEAEWAAFASEHDEKSVTLDKSDVYYKVTSNLDFSDTTERVDVYHFSGTIDFDGHTVKGITPENSVYKYGTGLTTGLFVLTHDATIKNLNFELSYFGTANALALPVIIAWRGDVVLDNVTVIGNATHASNSGTAFVYFMWATAYNSTLVNPEAGAQDYVKVPNAPLKLTFNNCTNYANITNIGASASSGFAAAFLGQVVANTEGNTVEFKECVNEGTVTGYHFASMLMANPVSADKINTLKVENCVNNGKIKAGATNGASLVICKNGTNNTYVEYNNANSGEGKVVNGENGVTDTLEMKELGIGEDGNFIINEVEGATVYKMVFVFSVADIRHDENGKPIHWGTSNITIDIDVNSEVKALKFVSHHDISGYDKNEFGLYVTADGANYVFKDDGYPELEITAQPTIYVNAYNAEGEVLDVFKTSVK